MPGFLFLTFGLCASNLDGTGWHWFVSAHHGLQLTWQLNLRRIGRPTLDPFSQPMGLQEMARKASI
eukprot:s143_g2.t1